MESDASCGPPASGPRGPLLRLLLPAEPRRIPGDRPLRVLFRSVHIVTMAVMLGGYAFGIPHDRLQPWIWGMVASGLLLLGIDLVKSCAWIAQGSGAAFLVKALLLTAGFFIPTQRFGWYLAATFVASVGSHMPGRFRHGAWRPWGVTPEAPRG